MKKLIPYTVPELETNSIYTIMNNFIRKNVKEGDDIEKFEKKFADFVGTKYAVSVASGRAALYHAYSFFVKKGDFVVLPAYTCIPAIDAARWSGVNSHFVDIDLNSYNPKFEDSVKKKKIGAISLSYLYGLIGDLEPFLEYAKDNNIAVIEDSAIALGGSYKKKNAGSIGDAGIFSLQESKILTSWRGGIITTDNKEFYEHVKNGQSLEYPSSSKLMFNLLFSYKRSRYSNPRIYGCTMYALKRMMTSKKLKPFLAKVMGFNPTESIDGISPEHMPETDKMKFSNIQAATSLRSLQRVDRIIKKRRKLAKMLSDGLKDLNVIIPSEKNDVRHAYGRFPIRIEGKNKFRLHYYFLKKGIETSLNYPYITPKTRFMLKFALGKYPNAEKASKETLLLPFHTYLKEGDIETIIDAVKKYER